MALRIYDYDMSSYVDLPEAEIRNQLQFDPIQTTGNTVDGKISVTDRGYTNLQYSGLLTDLTHAEFLDLMEFFKDTIRWSLYQFWLRIPNHRTSSSTYNQRNIPWRCDATVGGSTVTVDQSVNGSTVYCDMRIPADYEYIGPLRLKPGGFKFTESPDSYYSVSLAAEQEHYD